jgi:LuxR family transcriptional activator of conjugal transfer of Ti plasmids
MTRWLERLLDITAIARDQKTLKAALSDLADRFGYSGYAFVNLRPGQSYAVSNYQAEWQERYHKEDLKRVDPIVRQAQKLRRAFAWSNGLHKSFLSKEERQFFSDASAYGIQSGITIPVATPNGAQSMLTFASAESCVASENEIDAVMAASAVAQLHARIEQLQVTPSIEDLIYLSPKEATYVRWLEFGKTVEDAADIEGVKYNTVRIALADARRRYDLCNNTQLVALAIRRGLI